MPSFCGNMGEKAEEPGLVCGISGTSCASEATTVCYSHDAAGRMEYVLDGKNDVATYYEYDPAGKVTVQKHPGGATPCFFCYVAGRRSSA